jgi:putative transposase
VRRVLAALFGGAVGKDTASRVWRKTQGDWDASNARALKEKPILRLISDDAVVLVRLDKKTTSISLLVALGAPADGQKVLLSTAVEKCARWRRESVPVGLREKGLRALVNFLVVRIEARGA